MINYMLSFSNMNTTLSADCPPGVTITPSNGETYKAGDVLTCAADGSDTYTWSGTNGENTVDITSSTVTLEAGEFCLICTTSLILDPDCLASAFLCDTAYGKYRKQQYYSCNILLLISRSVSQMA